MLNILKKKSYKEKKQYLQVWLFTSSELRY